jgi:hypothetical protein
MPERWERWTIDEIDEGRARVLISISLRPAQAERLAEDSAGVGRPVERKRAVRAAVMDVELAPRTEMWSDERDVYLPLVELEALLRRRGGKPGLPGGRPLREGDVFWVVLYQPVGAAMSDARSEQAVDVIRQYIEAGADVLDVTAAARQAAKTWYQQAIRVAGPSEPGG